MQRERVRCELPTQLRVDYFRRLSDWMAGREPRHPAGRLGERWMVPPEITSNCWDTVPEAWEYSEFGNAAALT